MTKPKRHHYVPQFLQAPFTGSDGKLFVHRKGTSAGEIFTSGPKDVFLERHLYSSVETNGTRIPTQETAYSVLDGAASPIVRKLIDAADLGTLPCLSMEERETWDLFFYQQIKRVPGMIASLEATRSFADRYKDILAGFEAKLGRPLTKAELDEFNSPEFKARVRQNAIVKALADDGKVVQTMLSVLPLRLGVSKSAMPFLVARRPVARVDGAQGQIFAYQNVALWLPIAPRVVVGPGVVGIREQLVELHDEEVLAINNALAEQSDIIASADLNLLKRYVSR